MERQAILVILGPTASGKTARAVSVAREIGGEIISADSRQIYVGMDIGTGKDIDEYGSVPYHMIDIVPAGSKYNLYMYLRDYNDVVEDIRRRGRTPIVCGGTGLYIESILNGIRLPQVPVNPALRAELSGKSLDELTTILSAKKKLHNTTDVDTAKRAIRAIEIAAFYEDHPEQVVDTTPHRLDNAVIVGIDIPRDERRRRISERLDVRLESGMVDEVRRLIDGGVAPDDLIYYGLEYKYITLHVTGVLTLDQMRHDLETAIHQFAKRQMTWFRGMERRGFDIHWLPWDLPPDEFNRRVMTLVNTADV